MDAAGGSGLFWRFLGVVDMVPRAASSAFWRGSLGPAGCLDFFLDFSFGLFYEFLGY